LPSTIETLHRERQGQRFVVLLVNFKETPEKVATWVKANQVTATVLLDGTGAVASLYRVTGTPTVVVLDRDGAMIARALGPQAWNGGPARQLLDLLVKGP
jgi:hypothetical protein